MKKLLHIDASVNGPHSVSRMLSSEIVDRLKASDAAMEIAYRDLAADPLQHFLLGRGDPAVAAGDEAILAEYVAAHIVVLGVPVYNFGVPTTLKTWFDRILIAGRTFRYDASGDPVGLVPGKRIIMAFARGGIYAKGTPYESWDHTEAHLRTMFGFIGNHDCEAIVAEGLARGAEQREAGIAAARRAIAALPLDR